MMKIRDMTRSKGTKRYPHRRNEHAAPKTGVPKYDRDERIAGMYDALRERGWKFQFTVHVSSPHGLKAQGSGSDPQQALEDAMKESGLII